MGHLPKEWEIGSVVEIAELAERVQLEGVPVVLTLNGTPIAELRPYYPPLPAPSRPFTEDDPLWNLVGIATSDGPGDVSENIKKYLADAYADLHERPNE